MAAPYYTPSGTPATGATGSSSDIRTELGLIETALDKMPTLTASNIVAVNSGGTALEPIASVPIAQGGTGATTFTDGGILIGNGTSAITATAVLANGEMVVGDGTTDPVLESGATLRDSIGVGTSDNVSFAGITGSGTLSIDSTTDSTSTVTGSIHTDGGLGVVKNVHLNGDLVTTDSNSTTNTKLGVGAGDVIASGVNNTAFGNNSLGAITTGANCTAVGKDALLLNTANANTAFGSLALDATTTGGDNTAVGLEALGENTTAVNNTAVGSLSLQLCTSGFQNTAVGKSALSANLTGSSNVGIGKDALLLNTTNANTAVGTLALDANTSGSDNTAVGLEALGENTTSAKSTAVGALALQLSTGASNTAVGFQAGNSITSGSSNILIGSDAEVSAATATGQITIGVSVNCDQNNQITIGNSSGTIKNEFDTSNAWTQSSDKRKKTNIKPAKLGLDFICDLTSVTYNLKPASEWPQEWGVPVDTEIDTERTMHSFLAQDVLQAIKKSGVDPDTFAGWSEDSQGQRISKEMFIFPLVNAIKELVQQNKELIQRLEIIEGKL